MQKDRLIPERQIERNKPHQNTTRQFDAVYLNVFGKKKKQLLPYSASFVSCLALAYICAGRQTSVFVGSDKYVGLKGQESRTGRQSEMNRGEKKINKRARF